MYAGRHPWTVHYGPHLHPDTFIILSSLTYDPAAVNDIHGSESDRDTPEADAVTRPSTEVELDVRDENQFPKLSRPTAPPTRSLYMASRPTLTEQYSQIRNKSTPISAPIITHCMKSGIFGPINAQKSP